LRLHLGPDLTAGRFPSHQNRRSLSGQACAISWLAACYGTSACDSHTEKHVLASSIFPLDTARHMSCPMEYTRRIIFSSVSKSSLPDITMLRRTGRGLKVEAYQN
jgi:hypothetical protein